MHGFTNASTLPYSIQVKYPVTTVRTFNTIPNHHLNNRVIISATALISITTPTKAMMTPTGPSITLTVQYNQGLSRSTMAHSRFVVGSRNGLPTYGS